MLQWLCAFTLLIRCLKDTAVQFASTWWYNNMFSAKISISQIIVFHRCCIIEVTLHGQLSVSLWSSLQEACNKNSLCSACLNSMGHFTAATYEGADGSSLILFLFSSFFAVKSLSVGSFTGLLNRRAQSNELIAMAILMLSCQKSAVVWVTTYFIYTVPLKQKKKISVYNRMTKLHISNQLISLAAHLFLQNQSWTAEFWINLHLTG